MGHVYTDWELDNALRRLQQQNLQVLNRRIQERELLLRKMGETGLPQLEQVDTLLTVSQELGAALSSFAASLNQAASY